MGVMDENTNGKNQLAEKKKLQNLLKKEEELDNSLMVGNFNEDTWRELQLIRYKITITEAKIDGSFYEGQPEPQILRNHNTNKYE
jgi:hypothetical protein